jgi:hypothetical protein
MQLINQNLVELASLHGAGEKRAEGEPPALSIETADSPYEELEGEELAQDEEELLRDDNEREEADQNDDAFYASHRPLDGTRDKQIMELQQNDLNADDHYVNPNNVQFKPDTAAVIGTDTPDVSKNPSVIVDSSFYGNATEPLVKAPGEY